MSRTPGWSKVTSMPVSRGTPELESPGRVCGHVQRPRGLHRPCGLGGSIGAPELEAVDLRLAQWGGRPEHGVASLDLGHAELERRRHDEAVGERPDGRVGQAAQPERTSRARRSSRRPASPRAARPRGWRARRASSSRWRAMSGDPSAGPSRRVKRRVSFRVGVGASVRPGAMPVDVDGTEDDPPPAVDEDGPGPAQPAARATTTRSTGIAPARPSTRPRRVDGRRMPPLIVPLPGRGGHGGRPFDRG